MGAFQGSPWICCAECDQRVPLRIDEHPTWHYREGKVCWGSFPKRLMSYSFLAKTYQETR